MLRAQYLFRVAPLPILRPFLQKLTVRLLSTKDTGDTFNRHTPICSAPLLSPSATNVQNTPSQQTTLSQQTFFHHLARQYNRPNGARTSYETNDKKTIKPVSQLASTFSDLLPKADKASHIIDVGAAEGGGAVFFANHYPNANVIALDIDPEAIAHIEQVRVNNPDFISDSKRLITSQGRLTDLQLKNGTVDIIHMAAVAPYMDDKESVDTIAAAYNALCDGGVLVVSFYGEKHHDGYGDKLIRRCISPYDATSYRRMPGASINEIFEDAGVPPGEVHIRSKMYEDWHQYQVAVTKGTAQGGG